MRRVLAAILTCGVIATVLVPTLGSGASAQPELRASSRGERITCLTGIRYVEFIFTGPRVKAACADLHYHLIRTFGRSSPSLASGGTVNENTFAHDGHGSVTVIEVGADNSDINALAAGVLVSDGYRIHWGRWTSYQVP